MPTLNSFQYPAPLDWQAFERLCRDLYSAVWGDPHAQQNGSNGQRQNGVDIFGFSAQTNGYEGVQCKGKDGRYSDPLTKKELIDIVNEAKKFAPPLKKLIIATTVKRDEGIQEAARKITYEHQAQGLFEVVVESWDDILARLNFYERIARTHLTAYFPPEPPPAPPGPEPTRARDFYTIEEIELRRTYVINGTVANAHPIRLVAGSICVLSGLTFFGMPISYFLGLVNYFPSWAMALPLVMAISLFFALRAHALLRYGFTDTMPPLRRIFFEANRNGDIFITKLMATCPHCGSEMRLTVVGDWRYHTVEEFLCYANPVQHRITLDHTALPEP